MRVICRFSAVVAYSFAPLGKMRRRPERMAVNCSGKSNPELTLPL